MHPNAALITRFYSAFQQRDAAGMGACYHPDIEFSDPVFPRLRGSEAARMWTMLCARGKDLVITFADVSADDERGRAHWEATYTFSGTGRKVHNRIDAEFTFRDGLIVHHRDRFDLWSWTRQALGLLGWVLGWTPVLTRKVRGQAARSLAGFEAR